MKLYEKILLVILITMLPALYLHAGTDRFSNYIAGLDSPAVSGAAVTPHDSNELTIYSRALYVGGTGDVVVTTIDGDDVTFSSVAASFIIPIRAKLVKSTGTTATNIVALY